MPFVFLMFGLLILIAAVRGKHVDMVDLLKSEFGGAQSFISWALAIIILCSLGYIKPIRPITDAFVGLVILVMILSNKGFFAKLNAQLHGPVPSQQAAPTPAAAPVSPLIQSILPVHPVDPLMIPY